ncbi:hypothetical protein SANTM175S_02534 [Streptomyces antimycoticus]
MPARPAPIYRGLGQSPSYGKGRGGEQPAAGGTARRTSPVRPVVQPLGRLGAAQPWCVAEAAAKAASAARS